MSSLLTRQDLDKFLSDLKANECEVHEDRDAGVVRVNDPTDGKTVLSAIAKGPKGPYICRFTNSTRIAWGAPAIPSPVAPTA